MEIRTLGVVGGGQMGSGIAHVAAAAGCRGHARRRRGPVAREGARHDREEPRPRGRQGQAHRRGEGRGARAAHDDDPARGPRRRGRSSSRRSSRTRRSRRSSSAGSTRSAGRRRSSPRTPRRSRSRAWPRRRGGPDRFIGMHFMNPVPVMAARRGDPRHRDLRRDGRGRRRRSPARMGKTPIFCNDYPGFVSNRVLMPMINEAIEALREGVATREAIDGIMKLGMNHPMGPLTLADFIGLDTCLAILRVLQEGFGDPEVPPEPAARAAWSTPAGSARSRAGASTSTELTRRLTTHDSRLRHVLPGLRPEELRRRGVLRPLQLEAPRALRASASSRRAGEPQEEIPFDEHLLERISTLEDVVKRTAEAVKSLFESMGNLEKNLFVAHTGILALQETLERRGRRPLRGGRRPLGIQDGRADAGGREEGPLPRAPRPHHRPLLGRRPRGVPARSCARRSSRSSRSTPTAGSGVLEELYRADRGNVELGFYLAETFFSAGDLERASAYFKKILAVDPNHFEALVYSGIAASESRRHGGGRGGARSARSSASPTPSCRTSRSARSTRTCRAGSEAETGARRGRSTARPCPRRTSCSATCCARRASSRARSSEFEEALRLAPESEEAVFQLGLCYLEKNWHKRALECFQQALEKNPRRLEYQEAVRLLERRQRLRAAARGRPGRGGVPATPRRAPRAARCARAQELYRKAMRGRAAQPDDPGLLRAALGVDGALEGGDRGLPRGARRRIRRTSSRRRPARRSPRRCARRASPREAAEFLREFLEKHPSKTAQAVGYYELATSLAESGEDLDLALDYAGRALAAAPEELKPYPLAALGWVHYKRQEYDRAIECLRRSSERAAAPTTLPSPRHGVPRGGPGRGGQGRLHARPRRPPAARASRTG